LITLITLIALMKIRVIIKISVNLWFKRWEQRGFIMQNMQNMFEAIWLHGKVIPQESISIRENSRLLVIVVDEKNDDSQKPAWQSLKGKYRGRLNTVEQFIRLKQEEKGLER